MTTHAPNTSFTLLEPFTLEQAQRGAVRVVSCRGSLDEDSVALMENELAHLLEQGQRRVILDLALGSSATHPSLVRLLAAGLEFAHHGGELKMVGVSGWFVHLALRSGYDEKKHFAADVAAALKAMSGPSATETEPCLARK